MNRLQVIGYRLQGAIIAMMFVFLPTIVLAAPKTFQELIGMVIDFTNLLVPILIGLAVVLYFWNISKNLFGLDGGSGDSQQKMREAIVWGLGILFVMVSIWGILNMLKESFLQG